jgi:hypothetical protein
MYIFFGQREAYSGEKEINLLWREGRGVDKTDPGML